jgi:iron complex transport system ATP-binding protein
MREYFFRIKSLCAGYEGKAVVRDVELGIGRGEILSLIGPNGAGKSTVLRSIAGQLKVMGGAVYLDGESVLEMKRQQRARRMSVMFTKGPGTEMMTCRDVVAMGRYPYTGRFGVLSSGDERVVDEVMELVHVEELGGTDFNRVSDGQRQRVLLARALCQEPEIVILDEPVTFLDVRYKLEFLSVLQEMRRRKGLTVIMSLHELELARRVSDKILCLKGEYGGRFGTPEKIFVPGAMEELFEISQGSFDERGGGVELKRPQGQADLFVIAGGGTGREVFHRLQREGRPFATGIIYDNDLDWPAARALACEAVTAGAFEPVDPGVVCRAKELMDRCGRAVCSRKAIGSLDLANRELLEYAKGTGMLVGMEGCGSVWTG